MSTLIPAHLLVSAVIWEAVAFTLIICILLAWIARLVQSLGERNYYIAYLQDSLNTAIASRDHAREALSKYKSS